MNSLYLNGNSVYNIDFKTTEFFEYIQCSDIISSSSKSVSSYNVYLNLLVLTNNECRRWHRYDAMLRETKLLLRIKGETDSDFYRWCDEHNLVFPKETHEFYPCQLKYMKKFVGDVFLDEETGVVHTYQGWNVINRRGRQVNKVDTGEVIKARYEDGFWIPA